MAGLVKAGGVSVLAAGIILLTACAPSSDGVAGHGMHGAQTDSAEASSTDAPLGDGTPAAAPVPTSGDLGKDLASLGKTPPDLAAYRATMKQRLCLADDESRAQTVKSSVSISESEGLGREDAVQLVRIVVAYVCPDFSDRIALDLQAIT